MNPDRAARIAAFTALWLFVTLLSFPLYGIAAETCDVHQGWTCGVADDGYHDGSFDWRHGVVPW